MHLVLYRFIFSRGPQAIAGPTSLKILIQTYSVSLYFVLRVEGEGYSISMLAPSLPCVVYLRRWRLLSAEVLSTTYEIGTSTSSIRFRKQTFRAKLAKTLYRVANLNIAGMGKLSSDIRYVYLYIHVFGTTYCRQPEDYWMHI